MGARSLRKAEMGVRLPSSPVGYFSNNKDLKFNPKFNTIAWGFNKGVPGYVI